MNTDNALFLQNISKDQLTDWFKSLESKISDLKNSFAPKEPTEYLTISEVMALLKCNRTTVYNRTKKGILKSYGNGDSILYKRSEVEASIIPLEK